jgi:RNA polymerase sigma-70 factor (ECF subfamily)
VTDIEFERIYQAYFGSVYRYLLGLTGDERLAEDITSETFFKAMQAIDDFEGGCSLSSWLCQIAKNGYYSHLRKESRVDLVPEIPQVPEDACAGVEEQLESAEDSWRARAILEKLDEPYKEVLTLRIFGELSFKQIAAIFGKSENWACVTYHRARKKMQTEMENQQ